MTSLDASSTIQKHAKIIQGKSLLREIYHEWYVMVKNRLPKGKNIVELGSGAGFIKEIIPFTTTSDVVKGKYIDKVINAERIPFKTESINAFVMVDTFHHIKNCEKALKEMHRCLKKGGKVIMIEPWNTPWSKFIYQTLHHEPFDTEANWSIKGKNRLTDANGALTWIVFDRDKKLFMQKFPYLKIKTINPFLPFRYILSGGLSFPQLVPTSLNTFLKWVENQLIPTRLASMFCLIELQKEK